MSVSLITTIDADRFYSVHEAFCLCFEDPDFVTQPTPGMFTIQTLTIPSSGSTFDWFGTTYTVTDTPTVATDIQRVAGNLADTTTNIANVLQNHPSTLVYDWYYLVFPAMGSITLIYRCRGISPTVMYSAGTAGYALTSNVVGVAAVATPDYTIRLTLDLQADDDLITLAPIPNRVDNLYVVPTLEKTRNCLFSVEMCTDIAPFIRGIIQNNFDTWYQSAGTNAVVQRMEWVAHLWFRYIIYQAGTATLPLNIYPDYVTFLNCREGDYIPELSTYYPNATEWRWLVNNPNDLTFCSGSLINSFFIYVENSGENWQLSWLRTPTVGVPTGGIVPIASSEIVRDTILQFNVGPSALVPIPSGFTGTATLTLEELGGATRTSESLVIEFVGGTAGGGSNCHDKRTQCGPCSTVFRFKNRWGVWETLVTSCEQSFGLEVRSETYLPCTSCGTPNLGVLPYIHNYTESFSVFSRTVNLDDDEERGAIVDFLTSPEIYVQTGKGFQPLGEYQRVVVDLGDFVLKENVGSNRVQVPISYKLADEKRTNTSD